MHRGTYSHKGRCTCLQWQPFVLTTKSTCRAVCAKYSIDVHVKGDETIRVSYRSAFSHGSPSQRLESRPLTSRLFLSGCVTHSLSLAHPHVMFLSAAAEPSHASSSSRVTSASDEPFFAHALACESIIWPPEAAVHEPIKKKKEGKK